MATRRRQAIQVNQRDRYDAAEIAKKRLSDREVWLKITAISDLGIILLACSNTEMVV